jgi:hypothetical protein
MDDIKVGDVVYIHGFYTEDTAIPPKLVTARVHKYRKKKKEWVAEGIDDSHGTWVFSTEHYNTSVFLDKGRAEKALAEKIQRKAW